MAAHSLFIVHRSPHVERSEANLPRTMFILAPCALLFYAVVGWLGCLFIHHAHPLSSFMFRLK